MRIFKIALMIAMTFSALIQLVYGSNLLIFPERIGIFIGFESVKENEPLMVLTFLYAKLFYSLFLVSSVVLFLIFKNNSAGIILVIVFGINMIIAGFMSLAKSGNLIFMYADTLRGIILLILVFLYYFFYYKIIINKKNNTN
jgi:hypothetical protein